MALQGFGLHHGWAIEGAIGSEHKVDASYLSPHVNMSARLEAATKQFGVSLVSPLCAHPLRRDTAVMLGDYLAVCVCTPCFIGALHAASCHCDDCS